MTAGVGILAFGGGFVASSIIWIIGQAFASRRCKICSPQRYHHH